VSGYLRKVINDGLSLPTAMRLTCLHLKNTTPPSACRPPVYASSRLGVKNYDLARVSHSYDLDKKKIGSMLNVCQIVSRDVYNILLLLSSSNTPKKCVSFQNRAWPGAWSALFSLLKRSHKTFMSWLVPATASTTKSIREPLDVHLLLHCVAYNSLLSLPSNYKTNGRSLQMHHSCRHSSRLCAPGNRRTA